MHAKAIGNNPEQEATEKLSFFDFENISNNIFSQFGNLTGMEGENSQTIESSNEFIHCED